MADRILLGCDIGEAKNTARGDLFPYSLGSYPGSQDSCFAGVFFVHGF